MIGLKKRASVESGVGLCYDVIESIFCRSRVLAVYHMHVMYRRGDGQIGKWSLLPFFATFIILHD